MAATSERGGKVSLEYMAKSTYAHLEKAYRDYYSWRDTVKLDHDEGSEADTTIMRLVSECMQYAREDGIRMGIRLMHEVMSDGPTDDEISCRASA